MKRLKIQGLVAAVRDLENRFHAGMEAGERAEFLETVTDVLRQVEGFCAKHGTAVADLAVPSRNAVAMLKQLAQTPAEALPLPDAQKAIPRPIRIRGLVKNLDGFLSSLGYPDLKTKQLDEIQQKLLLAVHETEMICLEQGTSPAGLPARSARAFAMQRWLAIPRNFEGYLGSVRSAHGPFRRAAERLWPDSARQVRIAFVPGETLWQIRSCSHVLTWRLALGFLRANRRNLEDAVLVASNAKSADWEVLASHRQFLQAPKFYQTEQELDAILNAYQKEGISPPQRQAERRVPILMQPPDPTPDAQPTAPIIRAAGVRPNDRCPCGSGRKHKKCCGRLVAAV